MVEEHKDIFASPTGVPLHSQVKNSIDLTPSDPLPNDPVYIRSIMENEEIKHYIQDIIMKGHIRPSSSLAGAQLFWYRRRMGHGEFVLISKTLTKLHSFLVLANFYHEFMLGFSHIAWALSQVAKVGAKAKFVWVASQ
jgi:hypothetical protein